MNNDITKNEEKAVSIWAKEIVWNISMDDVFAQLGKMSMMDIAKTLSLPLANCVKMSLDEFNNIARKYCEENPDFKANIMNLPSEVELPDEFYDYDNADCNDEVLDWFKGEYGFSVSSLSTERKMSKDRMKTLLDAMIDDHADSIASQAECINYLMDNCGFGIDDLMFFGYSHEDIYTAMGE